MSVHRFGHEAMATVFEIHCVHEDAAYAGQAAQAAFALLDRVEQELSRFIANSDVSRVNALGAGEATRVHPWTLECLQLARALYDLTRGAFDVSLGTGLTDLVLEAERHAVRSSTGAVRLDLGGIGKGYAVDRMAETLAEWDVARALLHGGFSSVRALDAPPDSEGWPLALSAPGANGRVLARISARERALSASGTEKGDHILDPRSGRPAPGRACWVSVPSREGGSSPSAMAEGLSTAFMILPLPEIAELCQACPGVEAWILAAATEPQAGEVGHFGT